MKKIGAAMAGKVIAMLDRAGDGDTTGAERRTIAIRVGGDMKVFDDALPVLSGRSRPTYPHGRLAAARGPSWSTTAGLLQCRRRGRGPGAGCPRPRGGGPTTACLDPKS